MLNKNTYEKKEVVEYYQKQTSLQPAEKTIFSLLKGNLKDWSVLDIGVGGGRTTGHLLPASKQYTGIDMSQGMVDACQLTFKNQNALFFQCDARDLSQFQDASFDLVLFSFNGIDCVAYEDRIKVIREVKRVLKKGGYFWFSTHNSKNLDALYSFHFAKNPFYFLLQIKRYFDIRKINGGKENFQNKEWFSIKDGAEDFQTDVVYIQPELQFEQLKQLGFENTKMYNSETGAELKSSDLTSYKGGWVYFLTRNN